MWCRTKLYFAVWLCPWQNDIANEYGLPDFVVKVMVFKYYFLKSWIDKTVTYLWKLDYVSVTLSILFKNEKNLLIQLFSKQFPFNEVI